MIVYGVTKLLALLGFSRIAAGVGTGVTVRTAMASYADDSTANGFPALTAANWITVVNANGGSLAATPRVSFNGYTTTPGADGTLSSYTLNFTVTGVPNTFVRSSITVTD